MATTITIHTITRDAIIARGKWFSPNNFSSPEFTAMFSIYLRSDPNHGAEAVPIVVLVVDLFHEVVDHEAVVVVEAVAVAEAAVIEIATEEVSLSSHLEQNLEIKKKNHLFHSTQCFTEIPFKTTGREQSEKFGVNSTSIAFIVIVIVIQAIRSIAYSFTSQSTGEIRET